MDEAQVPFSLREQPSVSGFWDSVLAVCSGRVKLWEDAHLVLVDVPLDRNAAAKILPLGLVLRDPPTATLVVADYRKTAFTVPYHGAALLIHVRSPVGQGVHCCWMLVDDDTAQIYGREILGYPKKTAQIAFDEHERQTVTATVARRGVDIVSADLRIRELEAQPAPVAGLKTFTVGGPGAFFAFNPVWYFTPQERIREAYAAEATLTVTPSPYDPIADLLADHTNPLPARFAVLDVMGAGWRLLRPVGIAGPFWFVRTYNMRFR